MLNSDSKDIVSYDNIFVRFMQDRSRLWSGLKDKSLAFSQVSGIEIPSDFEFKDRLDQFCEKNSIKFLYIDCRKITEHSQAREFLHQILDNPFSLVLIDHIDQMPEHLNRDVSANILIHIWKNPFYDIDDRCIYENDSIHVIYLTTYPQEETTFEVWHGTDGYAWIGDICEYVDKWLSK